MTEPPTDSGRPPPLREELHLFPGPRSSNGTPTWTLRDPATNQFFRIGWREFEILCRWRRGAPNRIAELVSNETPLETTTGDVQDLVRFLLEANLLRPQGERGLARMQKHVQSLQQSWFQHVLHAYLFFRIPLFNPDQFLRKTLPWMQWSFSQKFFIISGIAGLIGLHFITRQWDIAMATFSETDVMTEVLFITIAMILTKTIHELGHAYAAIRYGCRVPTIGVAFLMLLPVLYTDTSEVWKLASRHRRLVVGASGMVAELLLTAWASLLWGLMPLGGTKDALFFIATVSWISTLVLNSSPFLRFDGYYLLSDWMGIENLHERAGRLGRWKLREILLNLGAPFPDATLYEQRRFLIFFAWLTWIYRFFLYLGIAIAVYHLFFKLLGILLMSVEIGWFLVRPILNEFRIWLRPDTNLRINARVLLTLFILIGLIGLLAVPWKGSIQAPALLQREQHVTLYTPIPAQIQSLLVADGDLVKQGQILLELAAPELTNQLEIARLQTELSRWKLDFRGADPDLLHQSPVNDREMEIDLTEYQELQRQQAKLTLTAPFDGWISLLGKDVKKGVWLAGNEPILDLAHPKQWHLTAYVRETDLTQIKVGSLGTFLPEGMDWDPIECQITAISPVGTTQIDETALVTHHGGQIPVRRDEKGRWIPTTSVYRVQLRPTGTLHPPKHILRGTVVVENQIAHSVLNLLHRGVMETLIRETGF